MKVGGRTIQDKNILVKTDEKFSGTYKKHYIEISLHKKEEGSNPEWSCDVWHFNGGYAVQAIIQRCTIYDAIVYSLDGAML